MKLAEVLTEITGYSNYVAHTLELKQPTPNVVIAVIDYWRQIGNSGEVLGYCKKFVVLNYSTEQEIAYEDKATPSQVVRARKW